MSIQLQFPFTTPANYTYDSALVEVTGGVAKLKSQVPSDMRGFASFITDEDLNYSTGSTNGILFNGAAITSNKLDCTGLSNKLWYFDGIGVCDMDQVGCIRFTYEPNYSGIPSDYTAIFTIFQNNLINDNVIYLFHSKTAPGRIQLYLYNSTGGVVAYANLDTWSPVAGTSYEFELNFDFTAGATRLFIDGTQQGATLANTFTRDISTSGECWMYLGMERAVAAKSNGYFSDLAIFDAVQHTANYTPSATRFSVYSTANPTIEPNASWINEALDRFAETSTKSGSDELKYVLKKGSDWYYWNGAIWTTTDGATYAESNTAADVETNKAAYTTSRITSKVKIFLHSDAGETTPEIDLLEIDYDYAGETPDTINTCIVWGHLHGPDGAANTNEVSARLNIDSAKYKTNTTIENERITDTADSTGYWELDLVENANMETGAYYIISVGGKEYSKLVPDETTKNFYDLEDA